MAWRECSHISSNTWLSNFTMQIYKWQISRGLRITIDFKRLQYFRNWISWLWLWIPGHLVVIPQHPPTCIIIGKPVVQVSFGLINLWVCEKLAQWTEIVFAKENIFGTKNTFTPTEISGKRLFCIWTFYDDNKCHHHEKKCLPHLSGFSHLLWRTKKWKRNLARSLWERSLVLTWELDPGIRGDHGIWKQFTMDLGTDHWPSHDRIS